MTVVDFIYHNIHTRKNRWNFIIIYYLGLLGLSVFVVNEPSEL